MIIVILIMGIMVIVVLYGQISDSDKLIIEMYVKYMFFGGVMIVLVVIFFGMSMIDSILLILFFIFICDIIEKFLFKFFLEKLRY